MALLIYVKTDIQSVAVVVSEHLFGPLEFSRRDLVAINIQRARDHGLPDYNSVREAYGLQRKTSWEDINNYVISPDDFPHPDDEKVFNYTNNMYMREV